MASLRFTCYTERERESELSGVSAYKNSNPVASGPHLYELIEPHFLRGPFSKHSHTEVGASTYEFLGHTHIQPITPA